MQLITRLYAYFFPSGTFLGEKPEGIILAFLIGDPSAPEVRKQFCPAAGRLALQELFTEEVPESAVEGIFSLLHAPLCPKNILLKGAHAGYLPLVKYLHRQIGDIHAHCFAHSPQDNFKCPVMAAVRGGQLHVLRYFAAMEINLYVNDALCIAAEEGHMHIIPYLLEHSADVNAYDGTPLQEAYQRGHTHVVDYLLSRGAHRQHINVDLVIDGLYIPLMALFSSI